MDECFRRREPKARVLATILSNTKPKNWMKISRDSLPKFASDGSDNELGSLKVMLASLDRHLRQNDSKIFPDSEGLRICQVQAGPGEKGKSFLWERLQKMTKCNKSTYRPRWRAVMETPSTAVVCRWKQSKITPLCSVASALWYILHFGLWGCQKHREMLFYWRFHLQQGQSRHTAVHNTQRKSR